MDNNHETYEYATRENLDKVDERISASVKGNSDAILQCQKDIVGLQALYSTLVKLPETIMSLEKTVVGINHNLEAMSEKILDIRDTVMEQKQSISELRKENQAQNENINRVDNKSKIDWSDFVTKNFWKLVAIVATGYVFLEKILPL